MKYILIVGTILLFCGESIALDVPSNCPQKPDDEESKIALASTWFGKGERFVEAREYARALEAFSCALWMAEHPVTVLNAGRVALLARDYKVASELAEIIISNASSEEERKEGEEILAEAEANMVSTEPAQEIETYDEEGPLPAKPDTEETVEEEPLGEAQNDEGPSGLKVGGIVSTVVGAAGLVVGGVLQGMAGSAQKTTGETDDYDEYVSARDSIKGYQTGATISFVVGGVLVGTGIALLVVDGKQDDRIEVSIAPAPGGIVIGGKF